MAFVEVSKGMPCHITILYVHSIVSLAALFHATLVAAEIVVIPLHTNSTPELKHIFDQELSFSAMIPDEGVPGRLEIASPLTACSAIRPPPFPSNDSFAWFVLIARFECGLAEKVSLLRLATASSHLRMFYYRELLLREIQSVME
ncbi:hypothetical protein HPB47_014673 [Ixodes persulcatus]|uniref:Uncharacterized protein n=1 Tax=Ixodes persulcatus TaxID=34615 RepID=A0AC60QWA5_IXOPE|nr:hypothetical protein HPB47_014673 [Ixodes persulcatus]